MTSFVDLHVHTTVSDGTLSPEDCVEAAVEVGLAGIAITDHDSVSGCAPALRAARGRIRVVSGVELTTYEGKREVHIVGLAVDPCSDVFRTLLEQVQNHRHWRLREMVKRLRTIGIPISEDDVEQMTSGEAPGRMHLAQAIVSAGRAADPPDALRRYLCEDSPIYVPKTRLMPEDGIRMVLEAGGVPVFAHPGLTRCDEILPRLARAGLQAIEVDHPAHTPTIVRFYRRLAKKRGLLPSAGSDFHGANKPDIPLGARTIETEALDAILEQAEKNRAAPE